MAGSDLNIPEVHARVEHGRDEGRPTAGVSGTRTTLVPLPHTAAPGDRVLRRVGDVGPGGFEDPQAEQPEHGQQREVARIR
jgi:hypothetical protein